MPDYYQDQSQNFPPPPSARMQESNMGRPLATSYAPDPYGHPNPNVTAYNGATQGPPSAQSRPIQAPYSQNAQAYPYAGMPPKYETKHLGPCGCYFGCEQCNDCKSCGKCAPCAKCAPCKDLCNCSLCKNVCKCAPCKDCCKCAACKNFCKCAACKNCCKGCKCSNPCKSCTVCPRLKLCAEPQNLLRPEYEEYKHEINAAAGAEQKNECVLLPCFAYRPCQNCGKFGCGPCKSAACKCGKCGQIPPCKCGKCPPCKVCSCKNVCGSCGRCPKCDAFKPCKDCCDTCPIVVCCDSPEQQTRAMTFGDPSKPKRKRIILCAPCQKMCGGLKFNFCKPCKALDCGKCPLCKACGPCKPCKPCKVASCGVCKPCKACGCGKCPQCKACGPFKACKSCGCNCSCDPCKGCREFDIVCCEPGRETRDAHFEKRQAKGVTTKSGAPPKPVTLCVGCGPFWCKPVVGKDTCLNHPFECCATRQPRYCGSQPQQTHTTTTRGGEVQPATSKGATSEHVAPSGEKYVTQRKGLCGTSCCQPNCGRKQKTVEQTSRAVAQPEPSYVRVTTGYAASQSDRGQGRCPTCGQSPFPVQLGIGNGEPKCPSCNQAPHGASRSLVPVSRAGSAMMSEVRA